MLIRRFLGEELNDLETKELDQLEIQLEMSLKQIRSTKVWIYYYYYGIGM